MLIKENTRFPYPVLMEDNDDFDVGEFGIKLDIQEKNKLGKIDLDYKITLTEPSIELLVKKGEAVCGVFVDSEKTLFHELMPLDLNGGKLNFKKGDLLGRVTFRAIIYAASKCKVTTGIHKEFGLGWEFQPADFLAIAEMQVAEIGQDKLASMKSIFVLEKDITVPANQISVVLDREEISISANESVWKKIHQMRNYRRGRATLLSSVYMPALIQVLDSIRGGNSDFEEKRWFRVLTAKCRQLGIDKDNPNLLVNAQILLNDPLQHLFDVQAELTSDE